jgi:tetratricopeptide (TPR) repeat protein
LRVSTIQPATVARDLDVDDLISGATDRSGGDLRLTLSVFNRATGRTIARVERSSSMTEAPVLLDDLARVIATRLGTAFPESAFVRSRRRVDPEAWDRYALGRQLCATVFSGRYDKRRPEEASADAINFLQDSIRRDGYFAPAHAALAQCLWTRTMVGYEAPAKGSPRARNAALRAISLDRSLGEAYAFLGAVKRDYDWDWEGAGADLMRSVELDPGSAFAHREYGTFLVAMGRFEEGIRHGERARQLSPGAAEVALFLPWAVLASGDYEQAARLERSIVEQTPDVGPAWCHLSWIYRKLGRKAEADQAYGMARRFFPPGSDHLEDAWLISSVAANEGRTAALKLVEFWQTQKKKRYVDPYNTAAMYAGLDMRDEAIAELQEAYRERSPSIYFINVDVWFHTIRDDARYREITRAMNLDAQPLLQ